MRTEAYVNRLILATKQENADARKIARMLELTLDKVSETPAGDEALKLVQTRMFKEAIRKLTGEREEVRNTMTKSKELVKASLPTKKSLLPIEEKRKFRHFRIEQ